MRRSGGDDDGRATSERDPRSPATTIGLGRVVDNRRAAWATGADPEPGATTRVEDASEDSFPASDPPAYASDAADARRTGPSASDAAPSRPGDPDAGDLPGTELPDPEDRA